MVKVMIMVMLTMTGTDLHVEVKARCQNNVEQKFKINNKAQRIWTMKKVLFYLKIH